MNQYHKCNYPEDYNKQTIIRQLRQIMVCIKLADTNYTIHKTYGMATLLCIANYKRIPSTPLYYLTRNTFPFGVRWQILSFHNQRKWF